jgi:hypothetical protein
MFHLTIRFFLLLYHFSLFVFLSLKSVYLDAQVADKLRAEGCLKAETLGATLANNWSHSGLRSTNHHRAAHASTSTLRVG